MDTGMEDHYDRAARFEALEKQAKLRPLNPVNQDDLNSLGRPKTHRVESYVHPLDEHNIEPVTNHFDDQGTLLEQRYNILLCLVGFAIVFFLVFVSMTVNGHLASIVDALALVVFFLTGIGLLAYLWVNELRFTAVLCVIGFLGTMWLSTWTLLGVFLGGLIAIACLIAVVRRLLELRFSFAITLLFTSIGALIMTAIIP